ncbi:hypothetical protein M422DRAFT_183809, partial [Sphaerobolus stellatus SS14]
PQGGSTSFGIVAISPDSKIIATDGDNSTILLWDAEKCIQVSKPLEGHTSFIFCLSFSFDGKRLVSGSHDKTLRLWDVETGERIGDPLKGHLGAVKSAVFSSDGRYLASGSHDCSIYLWDTMSGSHIGKPLEYHTDSVSCLSFSEDGKKLVSSSLDGNICIWDVLNWTMIGKMVRTAKGHVYSVAFSRDSLSVISSGRPELLQVWDAATGTLTREPKLTASMAPVLAEDTAFTADGGCVASSYHDGSVQLWNIKQTPSMIHLKGHLSHIPSLAFAPKNKYLVTASEDATVRIWKIHDEAAIYPVTFSDSSEAALRNTHQLFESSQIPKSQWAYSLQFDDSGWIITPDFKLLLWVPPAYRRGLWWPRTIGILGAQRTSLDLSNLAHGELWIDCYKGI